MAFRKTEESFSQGPTRCGRCAQLLPDTTLTFCPECGVTFAAVGPTHSFQNLSSRPSRARKSWPLKSFVILGFCASLYGLLNQVNRNHQISKLQPGLRSIRIYHYNFPELPSLSPVRSRETVAIALQAFEDHFEIPLENVQIIQGQVPDFLKGVFEEYANFLRAEHSPEEKFPINHLSFWEKKIFPPLSQRFSNDPTAPLSVVLTNIPLYKTPDERSHVETRHLSPSGVVSGLGHPGLVLVSSFRIQNELGELDQDRPPITQESEKSRFVGEFVLAHELGHALLGLPDFVSTDPIRSPASLDDPVSHQCLMHTDGGGGFRAWKALSERSLGEPSPCHEYDYLKRGFRLRSEAIYLLKAGEDSAAEARYQEALSSLESAPSKSWLGTLWRREYNLFVSSFTPLWL